MEEQGGNPPSGCKACEKVPQSDPLRKEVTKKKATSFLWQNYSPGVIFFLCFL